VHGSRSDPEVRQRGVAVLTLRQGGAEQYRGHGSEVERTSKKTTISHRRKNGTALRVALWFMLKAASVPRGNGFKNPSGLPAERNALTSPRAHPSTAMIICL